MFTGKYFDWNQKRLKGIIDHYGHQFISNKKVLDLGCGYADIGGPLSRLGAEVVAVDARKEHLDVASKRYPGIKTVNADLDRSWPFVGQQFDLVLDLGLLCHLIDYEKHLKNVCSSAKFLVLETAVSDHSDDRKSIAVKESKNIFDLSINGLGGRPTTNAIERVLKECGMSFVRVNNNKFNSGSYKYDWVESNNSDSSLDKRRIWFCKKDSSENIAFVAPSLLSNSNALLSPELTSSNMLIKPSLSNLEASQQVKLSSMSKFYPKKLSETKINFILNLFSSKFFYNKYILDAGAGDGELGAAFLRLGAGVTAADARQEHLNNIRKKYPNIKTIRLNFESPLNINTKFDITLSIDTLCHISNYEKHLRDLCNRSKIIFLETAVCDSSDPNISFSLSENNGNNTLSFSGLASRPSATKIEKILVEQGMFHIRLDDPQLNYEKYVYDWKVINSKNQDISLRRFWICSKNPHVINEIRKKNQIEIESITISASQENVIAEKTISYNSASHILENNINKDNIYKISKHNAIITSEKFSSPIQWDINCCIAPMTFSARQWVAKINPFFPNLKIFNNIKNYKSNNKSLEIDLSICSSNNILIAKNIFIEEYNGFLSQSALDKLSKCEHIITPSFNNLKEIQDKFPDKKITQSFKPWFKPKIQFDNNQSEYAIYLEKDPDFTNAIVKNLNFLKLKNLILVGSRNNLSSSIIRCSEYENYEKLISMILSSKVLIDISSCGNYYSGIINFAKEHQIPVITNNIRYLNEEHNFIFIRNNMNDGNIVPDEESIKFSFSKFLNLEKLNIDDNYNDNYNDKMYTTFLSLLGK